MNDITKMTKKEKNMIIVLIFLLLLFSFVIIVVLSNNHYNKMVVEEPFDVNDVEKYIHIEEIDNRDYLTIYKEVDLKKIKFTNIQDVLVSGFNNKQNELLESLNSNINNNKEYIDNYNSNNKIENYVVNSKINTLALYDIKDGILSVLYLVEDEVDYKGLTNHINNIFIDLDNKAIISNENLLSKYNINKEMLINDVYNKVITKHISNFIDKDTKAELTKEDIKIKEQEYKKILIDNFDEYIYLYFNDNNLYLKYNYNDICNKLFNEGLETQKYSTLKVNIENENQG